MFRMAESLRILFAVFIFFIGHGNLAQAKDETVSVVVGEQAVLQCSVAEDCGGLHSVRWYRGDQRVALMAEAAHLAKAEGSMADRIQLSLIDIGELRIYPVQEEDEDQYRCELTYLQPADHCDSVTLIKLKTLIKPSSIIIIDQAGNEVKKDSALGGLLEGGEVSVECKAVGGKPAPTLQWILGEEEKAGVVSTTGEGADAVTTNRLLLEVERKFQGKKLKCSASSEALDQPMVVDLQLDLILLPKEINISGVEHHVVQGSKVTLECKTSGSRPPAVITWANGTQTLPQEQVLISTEQQNDGTYTTLSKFSFWATRWEHASTFTCEARQLAAPIEQQNAMLNVSQTLDIHYPPIVTVRPENITVNETTDVLLFCDFEANPNIIVNVAWIQNDAELDVASEPDHYGGGNVDQQNLLIKNSSEEDIGNYYCKLQNFVGSSTSQDSVYVDVHFKPEVQLIPSTDEYIVESTPQDVTLDCDVIRGNPDILLTVNWFLDGELLKQLPICHKTEDGSGDLCTNVEPSKLLLKAVTRAFHGNYSCQGMNQAGWGGRSNNTELIVYYEPGPAKLDYQPLNVVKGKSMKLTCYVKDLGRPKATSYQWHRGTQLMTEVTTAEWTIDAVTLESKTNFTCRAVNEAGLGQAAIVYVEISAPPAFITSLPAKTGVLYNLTDTSLTCRVECSPLCGVTWKKNGKVINGSAANRDLYEIINTPLPPDSRSNYFESILSELVFNITNWPDEVLSYETDNANYSCESRKNDLEPAINSSTAFDVEYPPTNHKASNKVVSVTEGHVPEKVLCSAKSKPEPTFMWVRYNITKQLENGDTKNVFGEALEEGDVITGREVLSNGYALVLKRGVKRDENGYLVCEASNKHGISRITAYLNVMYKPECTLVKTKVGEENILTCSANANPTEVSFDWSLENSNDTIEEEAVNSQGTKSTLKLELLTSFDGARTFVCVVSNSVGDSEPCTLLVEGYLPWWKRLSPTLMVIISACILLLLLILLCLLIICICRRKRKASKSPAAGTGEGNGAGIDNPGVYENLPFHGMQQVANKPFKPNINDQFIYADADPKDYGPINYKQASIYAKMKKIKEQQKMEFARKEEE